MKRRYEQPKPTDCQIAILEEIVAKDSIEAISYSHPERAVVKKKVEKKLLEKVTKKYGTDNTRKALRSLVDFHVLFLDADLKYGFERCWFKVVDLEEAKKLYDSAK